MIRLLLPLILGLAGVGGGIAAGLALKEPGDEMTEAEDSKEATIESSDLPAEDVEYARLSNQFIVPVVRGAAVEALVVLSITLEVSPGSTETVFSNEPRLRDRFLRVLFDHANIGGFDAGFTQTGTMTLLRTALLEAAKDTLGTSVHDVLIVDIVRQDS